MATAMQQRPGARYGTLRAKSGLVIVQVAISVVLVIGAGLMIRTFAALRQARPGIDPQRVITMEMIARPIFHGARGGERGRHQPEHGR